MSEKPKLLPEVIEINVDLDKYPEHISQVQPGTMIAIGDLHGSARKLLYLLVQQGILELSAKDYMRVLEIYESSFNGFMDTTLLREFKEILSRAKIKQGATEVILNFIGDEVGDRGQNDYLTLLILKKLHDGKVPYIINVSNHGLNLIAFREQGCNTLPSYVTITGGNAPGPGGALPCSSLLGLYKTMKLDRTRELKREIVELIDQCYKPHLKFISYNISDPKPEHQESLGKLVVYTHAAVSMEHIEQVAERLGIKPKEPITANVEALTGVIDQINKEIQNKIAEGKLFYTLNADKIRSNSVAGRDTGLYYFLWHRPENPEAPDGQIIISWNNCKPPHSFNLPDKQNRAFVMIPVFGHISGINADLLNGYYRDKNIYAMCLDNIVGMEIRQNPSDYNKRIYFSEGVIPLYISRVTNELLAQEKEICTYEPDEFKRLIKQRSKDYSMFPELVSKDGLINPNATMLKNGKQLTTTILYRAAFDGDVKFVEALLQLGADKSKAIEKNILDILQSKLESSAILPENIENYKKIIELLDENFLKKDVIAVDVRKDPKQGISKEKDSLPRKAESVTVTDSAEAIHIAEQLPIVESASKTEQLVTMDLPKLLAKSTATTIVSKETKQEEVEFPAILVATTTVSDQDRAKTSAVSKEIKKPLKPTGTAAAATKTVVPPASALKEVAASITKPLKVEKLPLINVIKKYTSSGLTEKERKAIKGYLQEIDINTKDKQGNTALHIAVSKGNLEIVKMLLEHSTKPDITIQNANGNTALHIAVSNSYLDITKMLLANNSSEALLTTKNALGKTPQALARAKWTTKELQEQLSVLLSAPIKQKSLQRVIKKT